MDDMIFLFTLTLQVVVDHLTNWSRSVCQNVSFLSSVVRDLEHVPGNRRCLTGKPLSER
jgi:hypothetical protein